jgi:hypothetical protein
LSDQNNFCGPELVPLSQWREEKLLELNIKKAKDKQQTTTPNGSVAAVPQQPPAVETPPQVVEAPSPVLAHSDVPKVDKNASASTVNTTKEAPMIDKPNLVNLTISTPVESAKPEPESPPKPNKSSHTRKYSRRERHNFASADCGAKTLAANSEAREISAILSSSRDRYMLNPCSAQRKWIVIELCEEVGVEEIMIANFEYFSSMFKEIQILGAAKYPVSHWYLLGNFSANNVREMQSFEIVNSDPVTWIKYVYVSSNFVALIVFLGFPNRPLKFFHPILSSPVLIGPVTRSTRILIHLLPLIFVLISIEN